jgi:hypothetical protein
MMRLATSLLAFISSLLFLFVGARQAVLEGIVSIGQTPPDCDGSVVTFVFVFITIACFWWVVRELYLRYAHALPPS